MGAPAKKEPVVTSTPVVHMLGLGQLHESPTNARRTWGDMKELTTSVQRVGVLQPALVRPMPGIAPDSGEYEIVFGHRRYRAAKAAHLVTMPCMVREMSDLESAEAQVVENVARQDVHPLEEAEGYELLHDKHGMDVETIAAKVGKSKSYVYARMKLLALGPEARKAFYDGKLSPSVALLVARVPASMQGDALEQLDKRAAAWPHEGKPLPFRYAADLLEERYTLDLGSAPFDRKDLTLVPAAGACVYCPKRAGNQRGLFDGLDGEEPLDADVCTDPTCFAEKRAASAARVAAKLEGKGIAVLKGTRTRFGDVKPPRGFVAVTSYTHGKPVADLLEKARGKAPRTPALKAIQSKTMMVGDNGKPVEIVREEDLRQALDLKEPKKSAPYDYKADQQKRERAEKIATSATNRLMADVVTAVEAMGGEPTVELLRLLAGEALAASPDSGAIAVRRGWATQKAGHWRDREDHGPAIVKLDIGELLGLVAEAVLRTDGYGGFEKSYAKVGRTFRVDLAAVHRTAIEDVTKEVAPDPTAAKGGTRPAKKATKKKGGGK